MRKILCIGMLLAGLALFLAPSVMALSIGFDPADQIVNVGDNIEVNIVVSDLGEEIVSAYDLDVFYDPEILGVTRVSFGNGLGGDISEPLSKEDLAKFYPDMSGIADNPITLSLTSVEVPAFFIEYDSSKVPASIQYAGVETSGVMDILELSLLGDTKLALKQDDKFTLATIFFDVLATGTSPLLFSPDYTLTRSILEEEKLEKKIIIVGEEATPLSVVSFGTGTIAAVPEPATILLLGAGLAGLVGFRRKKFNR